MLLSQLIRFATWYSGPARQNVEKAVLEGREEPKHPSTRCNRRSPDTRCDRYVFTPRNRFSIHGAILLPSFHPPLPPWAKKRQRLTWACLIRSHLRWNHDLVSLSVPQNPQSYRKTLWRCQFEHFQARQAARRVTKVTLYVSAAGLLLFSPFRPSVLFLPPNSPTFRYLTSVLAEFSQ